MTSARTAQRLTRILAMLPWVIANPGATVDEVCQRFSYTPEELAADLNLIFVCGLPGYGPGDLMDAYIDDDEVVVDMAEYFSKSPRLTPVEGLGLLASGMALLSAGFASAELSSAVAKLQAALLGGTEEVLSVELAEEPGLVGPLRNAVETYTVVAITYTGLATGQTTEREVEPWAVFSTMGNWYLSGYCRLAGDQRVFRIDRIRKADLTGETFEPPTERPEPVVHYTPGADDVYATIRLSPSARWVADYYPVEVVDDSSEASVIRFAASDPAVPARLLARLGGDAELLEGGEVAEALADLRARVLARYGASPS